ncbi:MAG: hypothetical protein GX633_08140, partial [Clostridiales bacterium]|nr:hypothetical protein [Clostridiales bacterium]
ELFSLDTTSFRAKGAAEPHIYGYCWGYSAAYFMSDEKADEMYEPMPLLTNPNGEKLYIYANSNPSGVAKQLIVTSACEYPELVIRWADYLYQPEVTLETNWGPMEMRFGKNDKGQLIKYEDTTHPTLIPSGYDSFIAFRNGNQLQQLPRIYGPLVNKYLEEEFNYFPNKSVEIRQLEEAELIWAPYAVTEFPPVIATAKEQEDLSFYNTDVSKLYGETLTGWIIGTADIDAEWDSFIEQMYAYGAQEVLDIKQAQADRYFAELNK